MSPTRIKPSPSRARRNPTLSSHPRRLETRKYSPKRPASSSSGAEGKSFQKTLGVWNLSSEMWMPSGERAHSTPPAIAHASIAQ
jgi:hypothetical protein